MLSDATRDSATPREASSTTVAGSGSEESHYYLEVTQGQQERGQLFPCHFPHGGYNSGLGKQETN